MASAAAQNMTPVVHGIFNTAKLSLRPESVDSRFIRLTMPKDGDDVSLFAYGEQGFRVNSKNMRHILTPENGLGVLVRLTYSIAVPLFASYFALYSVGCFAVTGILSGMAEYRGEHEECKSLATLALTHAAYAVYNVAMSYIASASVLYLPVAALLYAVSPNLLKQSDQFLHTHRETQAVKEEALETELRDFVAHAERNEQGDGQSAPAAAAAHSRRASAASPYATVGPQAREFAAQYARYRAGQSPDQKRGLVEGEIPKRIRAFTDSVMVRPEDTSIWNRLFNRA